MAYNNKDKYEDALEKAEEWIEDYWKHEKVNNPDSYNKGDEIQFDHQGFVNFCKKYCQKPAVWHREDEQNLNACLAFINDVALRKWLQDAIHVRYDDWKPDCDQLDALHDMIASYEVHSCDLNKEKISELVKSLAVELHHFQYTRNGDLVPYDRLKELKEE